MIKRWSTSLVFARLDKASGLQILLLYSTQRRGLKKLLPILVEALLQADVD